MTNIDKLEELLKIDTSKRSVEYPNYSKMLYSILTTFILAVFCSWLSSTNESFMFSVIIFDIPVFYFLLSLVPTVIIIAFIIYFFNTYSKLRENIKYELYTSKVFYANIFGMFILEKLGIKSDGKDIVSLSEKISNISNDTIKLFLIDKTEFLNFLIKLYKEYITLFNTDYFQNLLQYCLLLAVKEGYISFDGNNYNVNEDTIKGSLYRAVSFMCYKNC